jgi:glycosyltransferase involved in cell wall biosynthesis
MQEGIENFEIVIGDNNSDDGTKEYLRSFYQENKELTTVVLNSTNIGLTSNLINTFSFCKGKYIVILYGDDYFTDKHRLRNQFIFLESNNNFIGSSSCVEVRFDFEVSGSDIVCPKKTIKIGEVTIEDYLKGNFFAVLGLMFRNFINGVNAFDRFKFINTISNDIDDLQFGFLLIKEGPIFVNKEPTVVYRNYRLTSNNFNSLHSKDSFILHINLLNNLYYYLNKSYDLSCLYLPHFWILIKYFFFRGKFKLFYRYTRTIPIKIRVKIYFHLPKLVFNKSTIKFLNFIKNLTQE